ncbi:MAG: c-type cytochrome [Planctomycetota bacterium]
MFDGDKPAFGQPAERQPEQGQSSQAKPTQANQAQGQPAIDHGPVPDELWGIGRRDIALAADENYEQWRQTLGDDAAERRPKFWTAPGFEVTQVRAAAADEGSWIAMAFDDEGRLTVSREDRGLLRFTLDDDRASVTSVERFELPLEECRGLIYADGWLYANANNSRTVYRLKIGEDGSLKELASLRSFPGGVGHGRNDLAAHDGHLLSIHGDSVATPAEDVLDLTSPLRPTRRGDAGREGYLLRFDRAGREWEIIASGLRNPYGIAAHASGDLFTFDADNEFDMGTPWYRPTRIVQLLEGGDTGYREAGGQWPPRFHDQPENTPPVIDIGRSSPTSVMFGDSLAFPAPYRSALFALDWTYGRVIAVHLFPQGAGWRASTELFLQGRPLNVTDLAAGPDGAMYLITGGRKTQSALYRVAAIKPPAQPVQAVETSSIHAADANRFATTQRARRANLSRLARQLATAKADTANPDTVKTDAAKPDAAKPDTVMLDEIWSALDDADPWVRHSARIALEHLPVDVWRPRVEQLAESPTRGAKLRSLAGQLDALLALARAAQPTDRELLLRAATRIAPQDLPVGQRIVWARIVELSWTADLLALRDPLINHAVAAWPEPTAAPEIALEGSNRDLRRRLALLLARLQARQLPELAARDLLSSDSQEDRLAGLLALSDHRAGWTAALREAQFRTLGATADLVGGQGMPGFLERLRTASLATLGESERPALAKLAEPAAAPDEPPPPARPLVQTWTLEALLPLAVAGTGKAATTTAEAPKEAVEPTAAVARANAEARAAAVTRGERMFQAALCARCHRVGVRGPAIGPDLTHVAQRFSRRDILESIVRPSLSVSEIYRNSRVVTEDGKVYTGRVVSAGDYRSQTLKLNTDPLRPSQWVEVDKRTIAEFLELGTSPMPEGLLNSFTRDEIADLLAFLEAGPSAASSKARGLP